MRPITGTVTDPTALRRALEASARKEADSNSELTERSRLTVALDHTKVLRRSAPRLRYRLVACLD